MNPALVQLLINLIYLRLNDFSKRSLYNQPAENKIIDL